MNAVNILKAASYLYTRVSQKQFDMATYRRGPKIDCKARVCNSVGCGAGHLTTIMPERMIIRANSTIDFYDTVLSALDIDDKHFIYLFASSWKCIDNTVNGMCQRLLYMLENPKAEYFSTLVIIADIGYKAKAKAKAEYSNIDIPTTYNRLKAKYEK